MKKKMNVVVQTLSYESNHLDCLECGESIFNPICPECILRQFRSWIKVHPGLAIVEREISHFVKNHSLFNHSSQTCIACKKQSSYLCPYCFTKYIYDLLKQAKLSKAILGEFLFLFNYDFDHTGYYKEGERLGIF